MKFINTIEINPFDIADYDSPTHDHSNRNEVMYEYWKKCLASQGLERLEPVEKGSYFVDLNSVNDFELEVIIKNHISDSAPYFENCEDDVGVFCGGIVVKDDESIILEPSCCGDLESLHFWEDILTKDYSIWKDLWIGHPWIYYKQINSSIVFSDYYESDVNDLKEVKILFEICTSTLKKHLENLKKSQVLFESRIQKTLERLDVPRSRTVAKVIAGNYHQDNSILQ
ncbi:hypothetical protein [Aureibacter tunicatorum]|uniref:Uncharacterized protein n=1 Tax=Aureibacter tunicatorum TaxID=866807 RepID=A0AAE3XLH1_9BACT|nr:hypothetical protein [Aureibacter tunicatorum]MDR6240096.1 hypothetical protein [Aureibacter tunicatorum]BDD04567.1 hypothetical protein AUTU_20500 [Aureibacter tunicatorum]